MNLQTIYRAAVYLMLVLATCILSVDATDYNQFALLYPVGVAVAAVGAFMTVDRNPRLGLDRDVANVLALGSVVLAAMEYFANPNALVLALGHWLVYLQLVKMYLPKTHEDDWFLFLLSVVQVVVGSFIGSSDHVGVLLFLWTIVSLAALGLFYLQRETDRFQNQDGSTLLPAPDPVRPYPGLISFGFLLSTGMVTLLTLALGFLIFGFMPRWSSTPTTPGVPAAPRHLTGFSDQVKLGQMGEILESDALVMTVESVGPGGEVVRPDEELLWGGVSLVRYQDGRWTRESDTRPNDPSRRIPASLRADSLRQKIKLEATSGDTLFAIRPVLWAASRRADEVEVDSLDGSLVRRQPRSPETNELLPKPRHGAFDYEVLSHVSRQPEVPPLEDFPYGDRMSSLLEVPPEIREALKAISRPIAEKVVDPNPERIARALEQYLSASGDYRYSLRQTRPEPGVDPVIDFLTLRKEGHCEYFASSLALLLRAEGIPARVVNGFKGGDWNPLVSVIKVREKHAHSWVEALVGQVEIPGQRRTIPKPVWLTLDPTPGPAREQVVARVGNPQFRTLFDALRHIWVFNVVGFNNDTQERLIYRPIRNLIAEVRRGFVIIHDALVTLFQRYFLFRNAGEFFSIRGFLVSVTLMLILLGFALLTRWVLGRIRARLGALQAADEKRNPEVAFFLRLVRLLARSGLERAPSETQREFARRASSFLAQQSGNGLSKVPDKVVDAFYSVRFGQMTLDPESVQTLDEQLDALESALKPRGS